MSKLDGLYSKLQVPKTATEKEIKENFKRLVLKYHPDKVKENDRDFACKKLKEIAAAYDVIGNPAKRKSFMEHVATLDVIKRAPSMYGDFSAGAQKRCDVWLAPEFLLIPVGYADKFFRCAHRANGAMGFQCREDAPGTGFDEFFMSARCKFNWLPTESNPTAQPKFYGMCNLEVRPIGADGKIQGKSGWVSFGLTPGTSTSDIVLMDQPQQGYCELKLVPSPICGQAFRFEAANYPGIFMSYKPPSGAEMTGRVDRNTSIDFLLAGLNASCHFQLPDEALIPVVARLGGEKKYIKLTEVCKDPYVRQYFQLGMGCVWDFDDFATYFLAHYATWMYNPETLSVKLRTGVWQQTQEAKNNEKAKREADEFLREQQAAKRAKLNNTMARATRVLVLNNLVGAGEVDEDLEEETAEEAGKCGKVNTCVIRELKDVSDEEAVRIFLDFEDVVSAKKAFEMFDGRLFAGRNVKAWFYDEASFKARDLERSDSELEKEWSERKAALDLAIQQKNQILFASSQADSEQSKMERQQKNFETAKQAERLAANIAARHSDHRDFEPSSQTPGQRVFSEGDPKVYDEVPPPELEKVENELKRLETERKQEQQRAVREQKELQQRSSAQAGSEQSKQISQQQNLEALRKAQNLTQSIAESVVERRASAARALSREGLVQIPMSSPSERKLEQEPAVRPKGPAQQQVSRQAHSSEPGSLAELNAQKEKAIENEDFDEAKRLKCEIGMMKMSPAEKRQVTQLDAQKEQAIEDEDFDEAKRLKVEIETLKMKAADAGKSRQIAELEAKKEQAIEQEDFDEAKKLKAEIEALKMQP